MNYFEDTLFKRVFVWVSYRFAMFFVLWSGIQPGNKVLKFRLHACVLVVKNRHAVTSI